jgi:monolysocardiolipin acyltransferase
MSAERQPTVIPMWITGFDQLMPEGRKAPFKFFPKPGARLSIAFAPPVSAEELRNILLKQDTPSSDLSGSAAVSAKEPGSDSDLGAVEVNKGLGADLETQIRIVVTTYLHKAVEDLGRSVSGPSLGAPPTSTT